MKLEDLIAAAAGQIKADTLIKNANLVDVFSGEIIHTNIAEYGGYIVGFGDYDANNTIDIEDKYLVPGLIDGHVHIESSMVSIPEFARAVVPHGTTTVFADPHEIANVMGVEGIEYMINSAKSVSLNVRIMLPSCVPATDMETSGANLSAADMAAIINNPAVQGIAELMNFPGVIFSVPEVLDKIKLAGEKRIDGHAPGVTGKDLNAYISAGITSDHECTYLGEAREKLEKGMYIMIREGTTARNLENLLPLVTPVNSRFCMFVTDDRHPADLIEEGHIDSIIRKAIKLGLDPIIAVQMGTINSALYFKTQRLGAVAPGYRADMAVVDNLKDFNVLQVFKDGHLTARDGLMVGEKSYQINIPRNTMNVGKINTSKFEVPKEGDKIKVIKIVPDQIVTEKEVVVPETTTKDGKTLVVSDSERDILKIAVAERHKATGNIGLAFVQGVGLKSGAIASSVAHDSHNIVVVGVTDEDMLTAVNEVIKMGGGQVVINEGKVLADFALPIAGLMSDKTVEYARDKINQLNSAAKELGCKLNDPFMTMSFLALPVIPVLKLTDKGLVDVTMFKIVPLFE